MSVTVKGEKELMAALDKKFGKAKMTLLTDQALHSGAEVFVKELKREFEKFKDTGESIREITISKPVWVGNVRAISVHWKGPKDRYRIIHLNEFGTVKNPNPKGKGAIARAMRNAEAAYREAIKKKLKAGI
ncbi:hypothetical protein [Fictibacillus fluitans]|uniref:Phage protein, HK97 gp10 family n=1 Tax=Fictibacillus fluitans TaxID=3058422 RepID=A0ABT8HX35_9BACL|nr:hypothetical protein [Fictibacillus sp. NE201]MDN4525324.1 hypothetical protein [Fictibacillus sp. NE201]